MGYKCDHYMVYGVFCTKSELLKTEFKDVVLRSIKEDEVKKFLEGKMDDEETLDFYSDMIIDQKAEYKDKSIWLFNMPHDYQEYKEYFFGEERVFVGNRYECRNKEDVNLIAVRGDDVQKLMDLKLPESILKVSSEPTLMMIHTDCYCCT